MSASTTLPPPAAAAPVPLPLAAAPSSASAPVTPSSLLSPASAANGAALLSFPPTFTSPLPTAAVGAGVPRRNLTARLSVPLSIPIATDLVRAPRPEHGVDALGTLCKHPLASQSKHVTGAVQALISRAACTQATDALVASLTDTLSDTDLLMAALVDGLGRMDQVLWNAAKPASIVPSGVTAAAASSPANAAAASSVPVAPVRAGGWARLKPSFKSLLAQQARSKQPYTFRAGMMREHEHMLRQQESNAAAFTHNVAADIPASAAAPVAATAAPPAVVAGHYVSPSSSALSLQLTPTHASLNRSGLSDGSGDAGPSSLQHSTPISSHLHAPQMFSPATPHPPPRIT